MFKEAAVFSSLAEGEEEYRIQHQDKNTSKVSVRPAIHLAEYVIPAIINDSSIPTGINLHQSVGSFSYGELHPQRPQISHLPVKLLESPDWNAAQRGRKAGEGEQRDGRVHELSHASFQTRFHQTWMMFIVYFCTAVS